MQKKYFEDGFDEAVNECRSFNSPIEFVDDQHALNNANLAIDLMKNILLEGSYRDFDEQMLSLYNTLFQVGLRGLYGARSDVINDLKNLMISKQHDYGKGNILKFGHVGIMVRVSDKVERLMNLIKMGRLPTNEPVKDSYKDLTNYAIIGTMLLQKTFTRELKSEE